MSPKSLHFALGVALAAMFAIVAPARADWAVLRNGQSLHVTGYERHGSVYVLRMAGGEVSVPVSSVLRFRPEDEFPSAVAKPSQPSGPFAPLVAKAARANGLNPRLLSSVIRAESNFHPRAISPKGALGLMQLMPGTARSLAVRDPFNPAENVQAGARYLKGLLGEFGNLNLALAAYNAGPATVRLYGGVPPFSETRSYISRIRRDMKQKSPPNAKTGTIELTCPPLAAQCVEQVVAGQATPHAALP